MSKLYTTPSADPASKRSLSLLPWDRESKSKSLRYKLYKLSAHELDIELGIGASPEEIQKQSDLISARWLLRRTENQVALMLGGFQGSGKTTTLEILARQLDLLTISSDEIRHNLFSQKYPFSEKFVQLVNATKFELIRRALESGQSLAVDQAITPDRIRLTWEIIGRYPNYHFVSVLLYAPTEILKERVVQRQQLPGRYKGTIAELETSIDKYTERYGDPLNSGCDLTINTTLSKPNIIASIIKKYISSSAK